MISRDITPLATTGPNAGIIDGGMNGHDFIRDRHSDLAEDVSGSP
jgi:hypothetical protein